MGGWEGATQQRSHSTIVRVNEEVTPVRLWRSGRGSQRSGQGGAPWRRGTHGGIGGVGEQPEEVAAVGLLAKEDDGGGTPIAWLR
jgi:hypothetical protein